MDSSRVSDPQIQQRPFDQNLPTKTVNDSSLNKHISTSIASENLTGSQPQQPPVQVQSKITLIRKPEPLLIQNKRQKSAAFHPTQETRESLKQQIQESSSPIQQHFQEPNPKGSGPHNRYYYGNNEHAVQGYHSPEMRQVFYHEMPQNYQQFFYCYGCPGCQYEAAMHAQQHQMYYYHAIAHEEPHLNAAFQTPHKAVPVVDPIKGKPAFLELASPLAKAAGISPKNPGYETPHSSGQDYYEDHLRILQHQRPSHSSSQFRQQVLPIEKSASHFSNNQTANFASPDAKIKQQQALRWQASNANGQPGYCDDQMGFQTCTPGGLSIYSNKKNVIQSDHISTSHKIQFTEVCQSEDQPFPQGVVVQQPPVPGQLTYVIDCMCPGCAYPAEGFQFQAEAEEEEDYREEATAELQTESKIVIRPPKREQKSVEKLQLKHSKSMSSVKMQPSKGAISEVKLKRSPSVSRISKHPPAEHLALPGQLARRRRRDSDNKENFELSSSQRPPPPNPSLRSSELQSTQIQIQQATVLQDTPIKRNNPIVPCNCKQSKCLKRYCECLKNGRECTPLCACCNCENHAGNPHREEFLAALRQKKQLLQTEVASVSCRCQMSKCRLRYCECYQAGVQCSDKCGCTDCRNQKSDSHCDHPPPDSKGGDLMLKIDETKLQTPQIIKSSVGQKKHGVNSEEQSSGEAFSKNKVTIKERLSSSGVQQTTATSSGVNQRPRFGEMSDLKPRDLALELTKNRANVEKKQVDEPQVSTRLRVRKQSNVQQNFFA